MHCDDLTNDVLADRADGTLGEDRRHAVEAHLEACPACRRRAAEIDALLEGARDWPAERPVPERVDAAVGRAIRRTGGAMPPGREGRGDRPAFFTVLTALAAGLVLAATSYLGGALTGSGLGLHGIGSSREVREAHAAALESEARSRRLERELAIVQVDLEAARTERDRWRSELESAGSLIEMASRTIQDLRSTLDRLREEVERERAQAVDLGAERVELALRVEGLEKEFEALRRRDAEARSRIETLQTERKSLADDLFSARAGILDMSEENDALRKAVAARERQEAARDAEGICARIAAGAEVPFEASLDLNGDGAVDVADAMLLTMRAGKGAR